MKKIRYKFLAKIKNKIFRGSNFLFLAFCLINYDRSFADWDPTYLGKDINEGVLKDDKYQELKQKITSYLKDSWCSSEKISLIMDLVLLEKPKSCVEIGVFSGSSLLPVAATLKYLKQGKVYAIDAWSNDESIRHLSADDPNKKWWKNLKMNDVYKSFTAMANDFKINSVCKIIKNSSKIAVDEIKTIDFLHIDGNYSEQGSYEDVKLYLPKVKIGGYVLFPNINWLVNKKMPRAKAFELLLEYCEIIAIIDEGNTFLVRKIIN